ncbi:amino acid adenylation domain-containing protein [Pendulispora rubella]|uniref:Amino acid adenylation domain-containing protein n=1 Tax=Pendulispora rubella TaxID=2741070 RepID=A0ABZ2KWM4_9BACT|nr:SrbC [Sorangiineae bacterium]
MPSHDSFLDVRGTIARVLGVPAESIDDASNLIELGLDSIAMMRLAGQWRRQGITVAFAELAANPVVSAWRALLEKPAPRASSEASSHADPIAVDERAPFELALMQHAYWVGREQGQKLGGVAAHFYNEFDGENVDPARLERAVRALMQRHGMLRVRIGCDGLQRIVEGDVWPGLEVHDLRTRTEDEAREALALLRRQLSHRQMDLERGEVFDVQLSLLPEGRTRLHVNLDMVAADALSLRVLLGDLAHLYDGNEPPLPAIGYSYPRYLRAHAQRTRAGDQAYWRARLEQLPSAPQLPAAVQVADVTTVVRRHRWLPPERAREFEARARRHGLTPAMAMAAVFAEALGAWSDAPRFLLNLPVFDREPLHPDVGLIVGDFTSSILLAWDGETPGSFAERAKRLQSRFHEDAEHVGYSGVEVLRDLSRARAEQVLAPVVYTSALGLGELFPASVKERFGTASWIISQGPQVWLDAQVTELDGGWLVNVDARESAFAPGVLDALFEAHGQLLERLLGECGAWDEPVPALLPAEQMQTRRAANDTAKPRSGKRLHDGFFERAERDPEAIALVWGEDGAMSYGELRHRALRVAAHLQAHGVAAGDAVAVHLPKGHEQIVAVLGVLAAGAAYVPVAIDQPALRRERIYRAAQVAYVLERDSLALGHALPGEGPTLPAPLSGSDAARAYVLFTSGSTGEPKGVELHHAAAMNTIEDLNRRLALGAADRTLALSALEFDLSVYDMFAPLTAGGAIVCIEERERRDAYAWLDRAKRHGVTVLNCVPALLDMTLTASGGEALPTLRAVLTGGDWVGTDLPRRLSAWSPHCRFLALGGTTETAIHSTLCEVTDVARMPAHWTSIPYGKPLDNVQLRVVDGLGRDCPDFVAGELWIGGDGVALGYRGDPARSAEKFVSEQGTRWYRTGDRARYVAGGDVEFLGRADFQVKLRGHRIELGEVEAALRSFPGIERAIVLLGKHALAAVVVGPSPVDVASVRAFLAERLPAFMLPEQLVHCTELPLTANGKVDRKQLERWVASLAPGDNRGASAPVGEIEQRVALAWSEALGVVAPGREDNFFAAGGDSLVATRLVRRLLDHGLCDVKLSELFARPILSDFAATLRLGEGALAAPTLTVDPSRRHEPFPPTEVQRAYWLGRNPNFTLGGVGCHFYREYDIDDLDVPRLAAAVDALVQRHEMLRAVFDENGEQRILLEVPPFAIEVVEAGEDPERAHAELRNELGHRCYDPARWPLFAMRGVRSGTRTRLGVSLDNLVVDALSILTFYAELNTLYRTPDARLPPIELSFRDYVVGLPADPRARTAARAFWERKLPTLPLAPQLPLAKSPTEIGRPHFIRFEGRIDAGDWTRILGHASTCGVTASTVLLTTFADVLSRWSSHPDLTINVTLFDRREVHPDIHRVMGDFTSLSLVGYRPTAGESHAARARRMQGELGQALDHREVSSISLVREMARAAGRPDLSMPVIFTSALGVPGGTSAPASGPFSRPVWGLTQTPQVWLDHQVVESDGGIALNWDVVEGLFPEGMVADMFEAYLRALRWLAAHAWTQPLPDALPDAHRRVRDDVNATACAYPQRTLHEAFFRIAREQPTRTALHWDDAQAQSYGALAEQALRVAAMLKHRGVEPGDLVAVSVPRGPEQIAAVLGVLAAGAGYVPIALDQPIARREAMLRQAGVRCSITDSIREARSFDPAREPVVGDPEGTAYVIFTSGSTGEPKGVEISHRAAHNTIVDIQRRFDVGASDRVLAVSALDFDLSVFDIFGLLSVGGALVLLDEEHRRDPRRWHELAAQHRVTVWNSVPTLLDMLLLVAHQASLALRLVLVSGDWVGLTLPSRLQVVRSGCRFVAMGGATEAAIWSNFVEVERVPAGWQSIPYGRPLGNQSFRVVDAHGRDCPDWVPGELWIGGAGVARGYRSSPELTARKFVEHGGARWYRTGDRGRYWPDGTLEFLGRTDHQVKIRGHRIELGEIEAALKSHSEVREAIVAAHDGRLLAVVVLANDVSEQALRAVLEGKLPSHMIPARIQRIDRVSLTANGKVNRAQVLEQLAGLAGAPDAPSEPLRGDWEHSIAALWSELFGGRSVGPLQSFFELGGDSLLATRFLEALRQRHSIQLPQRRLFTGPTVREIAAAIAADPTVAHFEEGAL